MPPAKRLLLSTPGVLTAVLLALSMATAAQAGKESLSVDAAGAVLAHAPLHLRVGIPQGALGGEMEVAIWAGRELIDELSLPPGSNEITLDEADLSAGAHLIQVTSGAMRDSLTVRALPAWLSILPPLLAILLALLLKDVLLSLFLGIFIGSLTLCAWNPLAAFGRSIDHFVVSALADADHAAILIFSTLLGGMVGVITKSGGTLGIVDAITRLATNARRGQIASWLMGILIFFDDYANTLVVGSTMRPITDRLRVSREKLAYIVDSTAAPVASLFPISTWIGYEVGLIGDSFSRLGLDFNAYNAFLGSIPFRFYPIFALIMGFAIAVSGRDFGPMLKAERRARATGRTLADDAVPLADFESSNLAPPPQLKPRARNAFLPISTVVAVTVIGLFVTGAPEGDLGEESLLVWVRTCLENADSYAALLWASLAGVIVALFLAALQPELPFRGAMTGLLEGFKSMLPAVVVLILAWSLGAVCGELHTADFLVGATEGVLSPVWMPAAVFVLSAAISFATGTSWATMAILFPLALPIVHNLALIAGHPVGSDTYYTLLLGTISSVLAGSVWGDHCSPISDTTILSSMASGCDHIAHVRTQIPYAVGAGVVGVLVGDIPTALGMSPWISLIVGSAVIVVAVRWLGRRSEG